MLAAALFALLLADDEPNVLPAADAALLPVTPFELVCERALAAAFLAAGGADFDANVLPAADAAFLPVCSFAIMSPLVHLVDTASQRYVDLSVLVRSYVPEAGPWLATDPDHGRG